MFELALNCEDPNVFLINVEASQLLGDRYFWTKRLELKELSSLTEELNYKSYINIIESYRIADLIIDKQISVILLFS